MVLTPIQKQVMACIAANRSETSYIAGGTALNMDWPRISDDIDIFHDTDEEIGASAGIDIETLKAAGFKVSMDVNVYGCVEASVLRAGEQTLIQWMSESRTRFFPLIRDEEWGARLHPVDLAVNKVIAASTRTKARDYADLLMIEQNMCPLGPVIMAAAGKPPYFSPVRIVDEIRRKALSVSTEDYTAVRGLPADWTAAVIRDQLIRVLDDAERYLREVPADLVGILCIDAAGIPAAIRNINTPGIAYRKATAEPDVMPDLPEARPHWSDKT